MKSDIHQLFEHIDEIPRIPEIIKQLLDQINNPDLDFEDIAGNIEKEPLLSIKVLRLVNSAHYALPKKISAIKQALMVLGLTEIRNLVVLSGIANAMPDVPTIDMNDFWVDSFRTASYAKWLADDAILNDRDMIFTAGLISELGSLLIHLGNPKAALKILHAVDDGKDTLDSERHYLGYTRYDVCAELCRQWQLPQALISTIQAAGKPMVEDAPWLSACALYIARYLSQSHYNDSSDLEAILAEFPIDQWLQIDLEEQDIPSKVQQILAIDTAIEGLLS
jgi:HD-like signal output (HDOD) protein